MPAAMQAPLTFPVFAKLSSQRSCQPFLTRVPARDSFDMSAPVVMGYLGFGVSTESTDPACVFCGGLGVGGNFNGSDLTIMRVPFPGMEAAFWGRLDITPVG